MKIRFAKAWLNQEIVSNVTLEISQGKVNQILLNSEATVAQEFAGTLIPGAIDIHCHGGGGFYFNSPDPVQIREIIKVHRKFGTARMMASLVSEPISNLAQQVSTLKEYVKSGELLGIHLEGPYLAPARAGAHDPNLLKDPTIAELGQLIENSENTIRMVTLAPERENILEVIAFLKSQKIVSAIGHSESKKAEAESAIEAGANVFTHYFNGAPKVDENNFREVDNLASAAILDKRIFLEFINDGIHLSPENIYFLLKHAPERLLLITDAMCAAGASDGDFLIGALPVTVVNGKATLKSNGSLAGSTLTTSAARLRLLNEFKVSLDQVLRYSNEYPAQALGISPIELKSGADIKEFYLLSEDNQEIREIPL